MSNPPTVCSVTFEPAPLLDRQLGRLGRASAVINGMRIRDIGIRRTRANEYVVTYPTRGTRAEGEYTIVLPVDPADQRLIARAILAELRGRGMLS